MLDLFCETCVVQAEAKVLATHVILDPGQVFSDDGLSPVRSTEYAMAVCKRCGSPYLTKQAYLEIPEASDIAAPQGDPVVLYPGPRRSVSADVPGKISKAHADAVRSFRADLPVPCAIMCRKAIEALCHELGASGRTLFDRLRDLEARKVIDSKLLAWADGLRVVGNDAAHDLEASVSRQDATDALEFIEAICQYVFSLSRRFDAFQRRRSKRREVPS